MVDSIIEEMSRRILDWRHTVSHGVHNHDLKRWAEHLRDQVQPQLDELETLKAEMSTKASKKSAVSA